MSTIFERNFCNWKERQEKRDFIEKTQGKPIKITFPVAGKNWKELERTGKNWKELENTKKHKETKRTTKIKI